MSRPISQRQFFMLLALAFCALNFVSFTSHLCEDAASDGIIVLLLSGVIMYFAAWCMISVCSRNADFVSLLKRCFGRFGGAILRGIYILLLIYYSAYAGRILCEQVNIYMLSGYSRALVQIIYFGVVGYALGRSFKAFANLGQLLIFPVFGILLFLVVLCRSNVAPANMLPLGVSEPMDFLRALLRVLSYKFSSVLAIPFLLARVKDFDISKAKRQLAVSVGAAVGIFAVYYILCVGTLGTNICAMLSFPAINIMHSASGESSILLDRYESIIVFVSIILYFYYCILMLKSGGELLGVGEGKVKLRGFIVYAALTLFAFLLCLLLDRQSIGDVVMSIAHERAALIITPFICFSLYFIERKRRIKNEKAG